MSRLLFIRYKKTAGKILEGGEQCSERNVSVLRTLLGEDNVDVCYIHDETLHASPLRRLGNYAVGAEGLLHDRFYGLTRRRVRAIVSQAIGGAYDYVYIDRSVFGVLAYRLKESGYQGRIICFFHNVEDVYFDCKLPKHLPFRGVVVRCARANDRYACRYADSILVLNERDADALRQRHGRTTDALVPIAMRDRYADAQPSQELTSSRPLCLCVGSYFPPNCEGIEWLAREVMPHVDARLLVVGKGMSRLREHYAIPEEVEVVGDAPDLRPYFEQADVMVLPIFKGSGMKVKTCESLMYGKNIIGTPEAFEGYDLQHDRVGAVCADAAQFIQAIQSFVATPRPRFNAYSRSVFLEHYSEDVVSQQFAAILAKGE